MPLLPPLRLHRAFALLLSATLAGCAHTPEIEPLPEQEASATVGTPLPNDADTTPAPLPEIEPDAMYNLLAAEISAQRKDRASAYNYYMVAAEQAADAKAAERAARMAMHEKKDDDALAATNLWIQLEPNSLQARQFAAILYLRTKQPDLAMAEMERIVSIAHIKDRNGFELVAAVVATEKGDIGLALMDKLVQQHDQDAHAHYAKSLLLADGDSWQQAIQSLERAHSLSPDWEKPVILQAQILARHDQDDLALDVLQRGVADNPKSATLRLALARLLTESKQYESALGSFLKADALAPGNTDTLYAIGMLAMQLEKWDVARKAWQDIQDADLPSHKGEALYFLAQTEELDGNKERAAELFALVKEGKIHTDAQLQLARLKAEQGQIEEARSIYRTLRVLESDKAPRYYLLEASTLREHHLGGEALLTLQTAAKAFPDDLDIQYNLGLLAAEQKDIPLAEQSFRAVLAAQPEHADTLNALGYTLADQTTRYDEAYGYILRALELEPESPAILDSMGWVNFRLGNYATALEYLQRAASAINDGEISAHLGEVLWVTGEKEKAKQVWTKALEAHPDNSKLKEVMQRFK